MIENKAAQWKYDLRRKHYLNSSTRSSIIASKDTDDNDLNSYASSVLSKIIEDDPSE